MTIVENSYFQNVVSDFITLLIVVGGGSITYRASRRRNLLNFFECSSSRNLTLYLSSLSFIDGVAYDLDRAVRGWHGPAVPGYEASLVASAYRVFLAPVPGLSEQKGFLRFLSLSDMILEILRSPEYGEEPEVTESGTMIAIGSEAYNQATRIVERSPEARARLAWPGEITTMDGPIFRGESYAVVQKVYLKDRSQWAFIVAGISEAGTSAAYLHLLGAWPALLRKYGHGEESGFVQVLKLGSTVQSIPKVEYESSPSQTVSNGWFGGFVSKRARRGVA